LIPSVAVPIINATEDRLLDELVENTLSLKSNLYEVTTKDPWSPPVCQPFFLQSEIPPPPLVAVARFAVL
jgi:hypothetical protein